MKTSTNKQIKNWNGIYAPKSLKVNVAEWLRENDWAEDAENIEDDVTFADVKKCISEVLPNGNYVLDNSYLSLSKDYYMDSFLRDVIFDGLRAIA